MNLLVISDMHLTSSKVTEQRVVLDALFEDLRHYTQTDVSPNYILFIGDLVNDPDEVSAYDHFLEELFIPLCEITRLSERECIFCPGNHDVSRKGIKSAPTVGRGLDGMAEQEFYLFLKSQEGLHYSKKILEPYLNFIQCIENRSVEDINPYFQLRHFEDRKLSVLAFSSVLNSNVRGGDTDHGKLIFPDNLLVEAMLKVPTGNRLVTFHHHPFDWFSEKCSADLRTTIQKRTTLDLYGHIHVQRAEQVNSVLGATTHIQQGSLFSSRKYPNSYSIISIGGEKNSIRYIARQYTDQRRKFAPSIDVSDDGLWYPNESHEKYWKMRPVGFPKMKIVEWLNSQYEPDLSKFLEENVTEKRLSQIFVPPDFEVLTVSPNDTALGLDREEIMEFGDILIREENYLCFFPPEFGQTSFARQLALAAIHGAKDCDQLRVPVVIDLATTKTYEAQLTKAIRTFGSDFSAIGQTVESLLISGQLIIILENFDTLKSDARGQLSAFIKKYALCKFVICCRTDLPKTALPLVDIEIEIELKRLYALPYTRSQIRTMVSNWELPGRPNIDGVVDDLVYKFTQIQIARTPALVSIFLSIIEEKKGTKIVNISNVVENFIEVILEKHKSSDIFRHKLDFKNKTAYLSEIAAHMISTGKFWFPYESMYSLTKSYFDRIKIDQVTTEVIEYFLQNKMFVRAPGGQLNPYPAAAK